MKGDDVVFITLKALRHADRPKECSLEPKCVFLDIDYITRQGEEKYKCRLFGRLKVDFFYNDGPRVYRTLYCLTDGAEVPIEE